MKYNLFDINYVRSNFITFSKLEKESRKTKKHIRHIIKLGLAFTFIIFFPISGCLQETILKSYEEKTGESINAYLCQAKDITIKRGDFSFNHSSDILGEVSFKMVGNQGMMPLSISQ